MYSSPPSQDVQLRFAHYPSKTQQQPIVIVCGIVQSILIGEQRPKDTAKFDKLMPVFVGPGQPTQFDAQDDPHMVQTDFGE